MKLHAISATLCAALVSTCPLFAQDITNSPSLHFSHDNFRVASGLSIFGYTLSADYRVNQNWGVRGLIGYADVKTTVTKDGSQVVSTIMGGDIYTDFPIMSDKVHTKGQLGGYGLLIDYYPHIESLGDGFRLTGGAMGTFYELNGSGIINGPVTGIRTGETVNVHSLKAQMSIPSISPYWGLGYNHQFDEHWGVSVDAGVMYNVRYDGYLKATALDPADQSNVDAMMNREMEMKLEELKPYPFLPFIMVGATYRF